MNPLLISKGYYASNPWDKKEKDNPNVPMYSQFLLASEHPQTKLWSLHNVDVEQMVDAFIPSFELYRIEDGLELSDVFNRLVAFEYGQTHEGALEHEDIGYPNATYFRDEAIKRGIVFSLDSGAAVALNQNGVPVEAGRFDPEALEKAADAVKKRLKESGLNGADHMVELFAPFEPKPVDYDKISNMLQFSNTLKDLDVAVGGMFDYVEAVARTGKLELGYADALDRRRALLIDGITVNSKFDQTKDEDYSTLKKVFVDKSFPKALSAAQSALKALKRYDGAGEFVEFANDTIHSLELVYDIYVAQLAYSDADRQSWLTDPKAVKPIIDKVKKKYSGRLSQESLSRIDHICLTPGRLDKPYILEDYVRSIKSAANKAVSRSREVIKTKDVSGYDDHFSSGFGRITRR